VDWLWAAANEQASYGDSAGNEEQEYSRCSDALQKPMANIVPARLAPGQTTLAMALVHHVWVALATAFHPRIM